MISMLNFDFLEIHKHRHSCVKNVTAGSIYRKIAKIYFT